MNLVQWLNEQKLPLLSEALQKKCRLIELKKVDDLKKLFATLSPAEVVKLLDIPLSFETLGEGIHLLDNLRKNYLWIEFEKEKYSTKFKPNFGPTIAPALGDQELKMAPTTMTDIVKKWNTDNDEYKEMHISAYGSRLVSTKDGQKRISLSMSDYRHKNDDFSDLLEFIRLEFAARMIPTPYVFLDFGCRYEVEL